MTGRPLRWSMIAVLLAGCAAAPPFKEDTLQGVDTSFTPQLALRNPGRAARVMWGGVVVGAANFSDHTDFTILSFPLEKVQRPDLDKTPGPRFIARYPGYVETLAYKPQRLVTVVGTFQGLEDGKVGEASYQFPVVKTDKIYLWPTDEEDSRVHFGLGLGIGVHM